MGMPRMPLFVVVGLVCVVMCTGDLLDFAPHNPTYVDEAEPDKAHSGEASLEVFTVQGQSKEILVQFDTAQICPKSLDNVAVAFHLKAKEAAANTSTIALYPLKGSFNDDVTWNSKPDKGDELASVEVTPEAGDVVRLESTKLVDLFKETIQRDEGSDKYIRLTLVTKTSEDANPLVFSKEADDGPFLEAKNFVVESCKIEVIRTVTKTEDKWKGIGIIGILALIAAFFAICYYAYTKLYRNRQYYGSV